jgi:large subunit ribosomal protein L6
MSRIGKRAIVVPPETQITIDGRTITVQGPKGTLTREIHPLARVERDGNNLIVKRADDTRQSNAIHGLTRTLIDNMVTGVSRGFSRQLLVTGVGYKVEEKDDHLVFHLGYSHPIEFALPDGIKAKVERQKEMFWVVFLIAALITLVAAVLMF